MHDSQGINQYQQVAVQTVTPERMIVMLYEGIFRFLERAKRAMVMEDIETRTININKAHAILDELINAIDHDIGATFTKELESLYLFTGRELNQSIINNDTLHIDNAIRTLEPLHQAWSEIPVGSSKEISHKQPALDSVETHNISLNGTKTAYPSPSGPGGSGPESTAPRKTNLCVAV
jgi:flagellar secretion chaperone FliS